MGGNPNLRNRLNSSPTLQLTRNAKPKVALSN
jgi:hypothetical protein